jgi:hypothetical protein
MGLLGASSLVVTIITMPQIRRLRELVEYASSQVDEEEPEVEVRTRRAAKNRRTAGTTDDGATAGTTDDGATAGTTDDGAATPPAGEQEESSGDTNESESDDQSASRGASG